MSNEVSVAEYMDILNGVNHGTPYSKNYCIISRKEEKKTTQKQILLKEGVGLPPNINEEYEEKCPMKKKRKVDPSILRQMRYK